MTDHHGPIRDLSPELLRCFVAVAEAGGFTAAGERLGLSQSGISVRVRRLEERLETRVFERTSRELHLTPSGEVLLGYARRILDLNDEAVRRLRQPCPTCTLRLGITDYFLPDRTPALLARFRRHFPNVRLDVRTGIGSDLLPAYDRGGLDILVAAPEQPPAGAIDLRHEPVVWTLASGASLGEPPLTLAALPDPCMFRAIMTEALDAAGIRWEIAYTTSSVTGMLGLVRAGLALAALPESVVGAGLRKAGGTEGLPDLPGITMRAMTRRDLDPQLRRAFVDFLLAETAGDGTAAGPATMAATG
jgi:DNA-binding transcriptional LysR family regulator